VTVTLYHGDCLEILPTLADGSVALVFIDLPYGLGIAKWDSQLSGLEAIPMARPLLGNGGSLYATCTPHILDIMRQHVNARRIITWCKPNLPLRKTLNEWEWSTEFVLWETAGEPATFNKPWGEDGRDYWRIAVENGFLNPDGYKHPARKPVALMDRIIKASTNLGDTVLDPFMGSGTTGVACVQTGRNFIGIEIDPTYYAIAEKRIAEAQLQEPLL
jgi:site-specific DNA-methyltransferase (adenine-specific)